GIERPPLDDIIGFGIYAQGVIYGLVYLIYYDRILNGRARSFIGGFAVDQSFFNAPSPHEDRTAIGEMSVHSIKFLVVDYIGLINLVLNFLTGATFEQGIPAKFTGQNNKCPV